MLPIVRRFVRVEFLSFGFGIYGEFTPMLAKRTRREWPVSMSAFKTEGAALDLVWRQIGSDLQDLA